MFELAPTPGFFILYVVIVALVLSALLAGFGLIVVFFAPANRFGLYTLYVLIGCFSLLGLLTGGVVIQGVVEAITAPFDAEWRNDPWQIFIDSAPFLAGCVLSAVGLLFGVRKMKAIQKAVHPGKDLGDNGRTAG